jgi:hypothetical protein
MKDLIEWVNKGSVINDRPQSTARLFLSDLLAVLHLEGNIESFLVAASRSLSVSWSNPRWLNLSSANASQTHSS